LGLIRFEHCPQEAGDGGNNVAIVDFPKMASLLQTLPRRCADEKSMRRENWLAVAVYVMIR
jgi:hypothetical protein